MNVVPGRQFKKKIAKLPKKIKAALKERLELFMENPYHPVLNNHLLHGKERIYRSITITGDYRLIYDTKSTINRSPALLIVIRTAISTTDSFLSKEAPTKFFIAA